MNTEHIFLHTYSFRRRSTFSRKVSSFDKAKMKRPNQTKPNLKVIVCSAIWVSQTYTDRITFTILQLNFVFELSIFDHLLNHQSNVWICIYFGIKWMHFNKLTLNDKKGFRNLLQPPLLMVINFHNTLSWN